MKRCQSERCLDGKARMLLYPVFLILLFSIPAFAQKSNLRQGALIKYDGTRVEGYFKQNISLKQEATLWFQPGPQADPQRVELDSIRELTVGAERYIVHQLPYKTYEETSLMKQVTEGAVNLFRGISSERGTVFLWRDREDAVLLSRNNFEGFAQSAASRCPGIQAEGYRFSQSSLVKLAQAYRDCRFAGEPVNVMEEAPEGFGFAVGIRPYWYNNTLDQSESAYYGRGEYDSYSSFSAALPLAWMVNPRIRVMLEPGYTRVLSTSENVNVPPYEEPRTYSEVTFDLQYIDLPVLLQYGLPLGAVRPFVEAGVYIGIPLKREVTDELFFLDFTHTEFKPSSVVFDEPNFGYTVGAGFGLPFSSAFEAELLARWTHSASSMEVNSEYNDGPAFHSFRVNMLQVGLRLWWMGGK